MVFQTFSINISLELYHQWKAELIERDETEQIAGILEKVNRG